MNPEKIGNLIRQLRIEKNLTQNELAELINVTDKAVSKWERGQGCPDVSLLPALQSALGVDIESILKGDMEENQQDRGNMKRVLFYVCEQCGNIITATGKTDISCCGRPLAALKAQVLKDVKSVNSGASCEKSSLQATEDISFEEMSELATAHQLTIETVEEDFYITFSHPMEKNHFISFVAYVTDGAVLINRLYPEQGGEVRFPKLRGKGKFYYYCTKDGFFCIT